MARIMSSAIVTPANSHDVDGDWLAQLEAGVSLSHADWEQLANDRVGRLCLVAGFSPFHPCSDDKQVTT